MIKEIIKGAYSKIRRLHKLDVEILHSYYLSRIESMSDLSLMTFRAGELNTKISRYPFSDLKKILIVTNTAGINRLAKNIEGLDVHEIDECTFINEIDKQKSNNSLFENTIVFLTNNSVNTIGHERLGELKKNIPSTYFIVQDWDSHHWLNMSLKLMSLADVYFPTHIDSNLLASRLAINIGPFVPAGTTQWPKEYLLKNLENIELVKRSNEPFGQFTYYQTFKYRNLVIKNLNAKYANIRNTKINSQGVKYHERTDEDRLKEWTSFKVHWIVPVLQDLPIRFFDALATGGIPLVPKHLRNYLELLKIPSNYYLLYSPIDIHYPDKIVELANKKFDQEGMLGIRSRATFCIEKFHSESIIEKIIKESKIILSE
jgi:hypothetical protein